FSKVEASLWWNFRTVSGSPGTGDVAEPVLVRMRDLNRLQSFMAYLTAANPPVEWARRWNL
ncbi:MAG TPA: hypothetical protein PLR49_04510, partial [Deltaproteobacteria bacterium]|nr:hypothetical protein [Deltaproteobacteria bacterium]HQA70949.1 hypothetical protein [Deltaproteobacteria bacterium]